MILEILGFLFSSVITGLFVLNRITNDICPQKLKRALNKLVLSNWVKGLPQIIPVYNTSTPKTAKEAGILAQDVEWDLEKPCKLDSNQEADDVIIHGVDDKGNCLVGRITRYHNDMSRASLALRRNGENFTVELEGASNNQLEFSLGNFKLELVEPFRAWRVWFNGYMRKQGAPPTTNLVHVTLNFLWKPLDYAKDFRKDANIFLLADVFSWNGSYGQNFANIKEMIPKGYHQFGVLHGIVKIDGDNIEEDSLYLYGNRTRRQLLLGVNTNDETIEIFGMQDNDGNALRLTSRNGSWVDGEASYSSTCLYPTQEIDAAATCFERNSTIPKLFELTDEKSTMRVEIWPNYEAINVDDSLNLLLLQMEINGKESHGIVLRNSNPSVPIISSHTTGVENWRSVDSNDVFAISLEADACQNTNLVGGKGASLAKLARMNRTVNEFKTAQGFCATTNLFRKMVHEQSLKEIFEKQTTSLEESCLQATELVMSCATAEKDIRPLVESHLQQLFGKSRPSTLRFAVRSSGVLEDGSDVSCAGQNETFLGVDEASIPDKIVQCWASAFTYKSVIYRLNHGQPAVTHMGVVIQELVTAASAGVLFTACPLTGNPFQMLITANYGLGESVVSATCDPDSIIIQRHRSIKSRQKCRKHDLSIHQKLVGKKKSKVILKPGGKSVEEESLSDVDSNRLCLTEPSMLQLGFIAIKVENELGQLKPVDIEWAITGDGNIFILQCRPMTSLNVWNDFEIAHQFDTSIRTRIELLTTANTGEVMPKPVYACSVQSMTRNLDVGVQDRTGTMTGNPVCSVVSRSCPLYQSRLFISVYPTLYKRIDAEINAPVCCIDLTVFGRPVITKEVHSVALERYGVSSRSSKIFSTLDAIKLIKNAHNRLDQANLEYGSWTFRIKSGLPISARTIYDQITADLMVVHDVSLHHCAMSEASSITLIFAFLTISEGKNAEHWSPSLYEDVGKMLSVYASVESAELPADMEKLGEAILVHADTDTFIRTKSAKEAISWLESDDNLSNALETFLAKYGHRSIAELDIGQDTWRTDPAPLIQLLKNIVGNKIKNPSRAANQIPGVLPNDEELLRSLKTPLTKSGRWFLKFLLPYCRQTVTYRERTKSLLVKVLEQVKFAYQILAEAMVREQIISDTNLIKHLTHHEMGLLIDKHHSSSSIINRAIQRMRLYPTMEALEFPEISVGIPKPFNNSEQVETCDVVKGTPVSAGKIRGIAKVCLSVEDASSQLEDGDILITKGTDIAWSPFFPMLGGVVTELGGLISHGAVVAREYGLPCIVGAVNATKIFQSGDEIVLDTSMGTISKVQC
ncbi:prodigiosin synthesizing transferase PigC [Folsomia candida]|uniref:prodigiosin synthesizing transferase PigC n=1 Tax=Folsomia candida TaxID=158441 RepID=UPI000B9013EE|nr:prodigiosin synthesizing transferase PigC [Folsomia candida]